MTKAIRCVSVALALVGGLGLAVAAPLGPVAAQASTTPTDPRLLPDPGEGASAGAYTRSTLRDRTVAPDSGARALAAPPTAAQLANLGPRDRYEAALGTAPRVFEPAGHLGHAWAGFPRYVANASTYSRGEFIYNDPNFDDTGAAATPEVTSAATTAVTLGTLPGLCGVDSYYRYGGYTYPAGSRYAGNGADLVEFRLAADSSFYYAEFMLQSMVDPAVAIVGLGITAPGEKPAGSSGFAASAHYLEASSDAATLDGAPVAHATSLADHVLEVRVPRGALPAGAWTLALAAGVRGPAGWAAVTDLGFVGDEPVAGDYNCYLDHRQSALIAAGTYPTATVDTARLLSGYSSPAEVRRGPMVRLDYPTLNLGQGIVPQARYNQQSTANVYEGRFQPYAAYVPSTYDPAKKNPLIMLLHCLNCSDMTFQIASWPGLTQLAESRGAIVVTPLAYGQGGHYQDEAEYDVFDVLSDVSSRYSIDRDRLYLTGMSMGALGTFRLGLLYPDLWARAFGVGNYTIPECVTPSPTLAACPGYINHYDLIESARNLPWGLVNGAADELTPITEAREIFSRYQGLGYPVDLWVYPTRDHDPRLHGLTTDVTDPFLGDARRVKDPQRVTYVVEPAMDDRAWGITHRRAYWLSDLVAAPGVARAIADARSGSGTAYSVHPVSGSGSDGAGPWILTGQEASSTRVAGPNTLNLSLSGLASATVATRAAGLDPRRPILLAADTDTTVLLALAGCTTMQLPPGHTERLVYCH